MVFISCLKHLKWFNILGLRKPQHISHYLRMDVHFMYFSDLLIPISKMSCCSLHKSQTTDVQTF